MWISVNWLSRYVDLSDQTPEQIRDALTMSTAEIEGIEVFGGGLDAFVVGEVLTKTKHPGADKLAVTTVNVGAEEPVQIVCGAPNVAVGQKVVVIQPGSKLPDGTKIKKSKIRGETSLGMICSERELGLSDEHEGILELAFDLVPGSRFVDGVSVQDHVLEVDNKSINHRPDLWGHYGFARELAAILERPLQPSRHLSPCLIRAKAWRCASTISRLARATPACASVASSRPVRRTGCVTCFMPWGSAASTCWST